MALLTSTALASPQPTRTSTTFALPSTNLRDLLLWATVRDVADLIAAAALRKAAVDDLISIV